MKRLWKSFESSPHTCPVFTETDNNPGRSLTPDVCQVEALRLLKTRGGIARPPLLRQQSNFQISTSPLAPNVEFSSHLPPPCLLLARMIHFLMAGPI
ncbi:hypothetical protein ABG768_008324 [Culter alburnus]|uniref:Uncharacterized protein n=1 Tax=Culter alburnus TaxID=194366 RepID=A0AAW1ZJD6_CULAL